MTGPDTNDAARDAAALALGALGWTLADSDRADCFLALTGMTPDALRARIEEPAMLAAILRFLEGFEPDLVACADALGCPPLALVEARRQLES